MLEGRDAAKAFYGVVNEVIGGLALAEETVPCKTGLAADMTVQIYEAIRQRLKVDWRLDPDAQTEMRNAIDDLLCEAKANRGVPLSSQDIARLERT